MLAKSIDIITLFLLILLATPASAAAMHLKNDGRIALFGYHEGKYLDATYRVDNRYDLNALAEISQLMRSRDESGLKIDSRLIELIDHIQDHFGAETIEVISGYRSPKYNRSLKMEGRGVAEESLHMEGKAADIHLDEVREEDVFEYVKGLGVGGTGLYPRHNFVHVDVGRVRSWREAPPGGRILVGTENNPNPLWAPGTDKDVYERGDTVEVEIANVGYERQRLIMNVWLERFQRGEWSEHVKLTKRVRTTRLSQGELARYKWMIPDNQPFGKYRLVIFANKDFSIPPAYSNEFYIKKHTGETKVAPCTPSP